MILLPEWSLTVEASQGRHHPHCQWWCTFTLPGWDDSMHCRWCYARPGACGLDPCDGGAHPLSHRCSRGRGSHLHLHLNCLRLHLRYARHRSSHPPLATPLAHRCSSCRRPTQCLPTRSLLLSRGTGYGGGGASQGSGARPGSPSLPGSPATSHPSAAGSLPH